MRRYEEPAEVEAEPQCDGSARPARFRAWGRDYLVIRALESWCKDRDWYAPGADPNGVRPAWFWRVEAVGTRKAVVVLREVDDVWHVVGVED